MKYSLTYKGDIVTVEIASTHPHERSPIIYTGDKEAVEAVSRWLKLQPGAFGHMIGEVTSPSDLHYVMKNAGQFNPVPMEGEEPNYDLNLEDGSVT